ncbi:MAG: PAS domain S-box protein [Candidatus Levyibacteriota bacterium]
MSKKNNNEQVTEKTFRIIFDQSPISTQIFSPDGKTLQVNSAWEKLWGVKLSQMQDFNILHDKQLVDTEIMRYIREGFAGEIVKVPPHSYEPQKTVSESTTSRRWIQGYIYPVKDIQGNIVHIIMQHEDITEQKEAEQQLKESESRFRKLFESNIIGIFISDFKGTFLDANDALLSMIGYSREDLKKGIIQRDVLTPEQYQSLSVQAVDALLAKGYTLPYEKEYIRKDKKKIFVLLAVARIEDTDTCIGFMLDITRQKALEQQKDDFLGIASHELKTPVTSLKAFGQVLQGRFAKAGDEKSAVMLGKMDTQINKLTTLIGDLLDISKIEGGRLQFHNEYFSFDELVHEIIEEVQLTTTKHKLLQKGTTGKTICADRERIGQVITNYLTNAIKYSPHSQEIIITVSANTKELQLCVRDFGIGIPQENIPHVFKRFYRIRGKALDTIPGMGLGLYVSEGIITRQGGRAWAESTLGQGSSFFFVLPIDGAANDKRKNDN